MIYQVLNRESFNRLLHVFGLFLAMGLSLPAQEKLSLSLDEAVDLALKNSHLLNVKRLQVEEKQAKVNEDRIKFLPVVALGGSYQYNTNLPSLAIYQGQFGQLPYGGVIIPLPASDEIIQMGNHNIYNAGVTFYQPLTQFGKINAGVLVSKTELQIARAEESKADILLRQNVEKLYFGLLILQKQIEETAIRVNLAGARLRYAENALLAGKTTESGRYGLLAAAAGEEQNLLKLKIQFSDYSADLKQITGIDPECELVLEPVDTGTEIIDPMFIDTSFVFPTGENRDLLLAELTRKKADYSVRASKFSYLPDLGILGGYSYQEGSVIYPKTNTFLGASLKWNLQDMLTNRSVQQQRFFLKRQAEENLVYRKEEIRKDIQKTMRKLRQSAELISVAEKVVEYRREDLKIQSDKRKAGLNLEQDLLEAQAEMAKAEADLLAARLNLRMVYSEIKILTGNY